MDVLTGELACSSFVAWLKRTASSSRLIPPSAPTGLSASCDSASGSALGPASEADSPAASWWEADTSEAAGAAARPGLLRRDLLEAVAAAGGCCPDGPAESITHSMSHESVLPHDMSMHGKSTDQFSDGWTDCT